MSNTQAGVDQEPSQAFVSQLGIVSDREIARRHGVTVLSVKREREARGIPVFSHGYVFPEEAMPLFGKISDTAIAEKLSISISTVHRQREAMGLPRFRSARLTEDMLSLLGEVSDRELSKRYGVSVHHVKCEREARSIPAFSHFCEFPDEAKALLGKELDTVIAARFSLRLSTVQQNRVAIGLPRFKKNPLPAEAIALLGTCTDSDLARRFGVRASKIGKARQARSIPLFESSARTVKKRTSKIPNDAVLLLGKISDADIASKFGLTYRTVASERMAMGIARAINKPEQNISEEAIHLLGKLSDSDIGRRTGFSAYEIRSARRSLKIPAFVKPKLKITKRILEQASMKPQHIWTQEEIALLGTVSDARLSKMTGIPAASCTYMRSKLKVEPYRAYKWTPKLTALLGKVPDDEVVTQSKGLFNIKGVRKKRGQLGIQVCPAPKAKSTGGKAALPAVIENLGKMSDYEIARRTGVDRASITRQRQNLGIKAGPRGRKPREWTAEEEALLGKFSDVDVGRKLGISPSTVNARRNFLKIPATQSANFWTASRNELLGTMVDSELAQQLGRSFWEVYERRKMLGVPPFEYAYSRAQQDETA